MRVLVCAGGPHMPPKTDPYDQTTPDGSTPRFIPPALFMTFAAMGVDMRWFASSRMIPSHGEKR